jgi:hypothetical protein
MIMANIILIGSTNPLGGFNIFHEIPWAADEDFSELISMKPISINDSDAEKIEGLEGLSIRSKILLSAVAGAAIQYLLDNDIPFVGEWEIKVEKEVDD